MKPEDSKKEIPPNLKETYLLLKKGYHLAEIASTRKLSEAVISMQIETIIEFEPGVDINKLFQNLDLNLILAEIKKGFTDLKSLKERLNIEVSFPLLRIAAAKYKFSSSSSSKYQRAQ